MRKNEWAYLTLIPISAAGFGGRGGVFRVSAAGTLVGLEAPPAGIHLEVKPYAIGGLTPAGVAPADPGAPAGAAARGRRQGRRGPEVRHHAELDCRLHLQHRLRTGRGGRAAGEPDPVQPVLSREAGVLSRGPAASSTSPAAASARPAACGGAACSAGATRPRCSTAAASVLQGGQAVPILGGGRLTGKLGAFDVGALNIQTGDEAVSGALDTNFTVLRVKRDILRRSSVGGIVTNRSLVALRRRLEPGVRRRRRLFVLRQRQPAGLLREDPHHRRVGARRQLPGAVRLRRRPLRSGG